MKRDMSAKEFIRKRDALDAAEQRKHAEIKALLPAVGARYGLHGEALRFAMDAALAKPAHAYACLKAIERSLVPR